MAGVDLSVTSFGVGRWVGRGVRFRWLSTNVGGRKNVAERVLKRRGGARGGPPARGGGALKK